MNGTVTEEFETATSRLIACYLPVQALFERFRRDAVEDGRVSWSRFSLSLNGQSLPIPADARVVGLFVEDRIPQNYVKVYLESQAFPVVEDGGYVPVASLEDTHFWTPINQQEVNALLSVVS